MHWASFRILLSMTRPTAISALAMVMLYGLIVDLSHGQDTAGANASAEVATEQPTDDAEASTGDAEPASDQDHPADPPADDSDQAAESADPDDASADQAATPDQSAAPATDPVNGEPGDQSSPDVPGGAADDSPDEAAASPMQRQVGRMFPQGPASESEASTQVAPDASSPDEPTEHALRQRVLRLLRQPAEPAHEEPAQRQLRDLSRQAGDLADAVKPPAEQLRAMNLQMQALYKQLSARPRDPNVDRLLFNLRASARQAKAIDAPDAAAIGDFWLTTADLFDLNRIGLPVEARRKQAAQLLSDYLLRHPEGPAAEQARYAIEQLNAAVGQ